MILSKQREIGFILVIVNFIGIVATIVCSNYNLAIAWSLGLCFGFVFQRSRFCTVGAIRDVFLLGNYNLAKGVLIYLSLSTTFFTILYTISLFSPLKIVAKLEPIGLMTLIGAFIFGIGMVIAGGCASGILIRMGEGLIMQWWGFLGLIVGSFLGVWLYDWHHPLNYGISYVFLPEYLGLPIAMVLQMTVLLGMLGLFYYLDYKNKMIDYPFPQSFQQTAASLSATDKILKKPWPYTWGAIILAILSSFVYLWNQFWGITNGLIHLFAGLTDRFIMDINHWTFFAKNPNQHLLFFNHPLVPLVIATVIGSFVASLLAREFRIRKTAHPRFIYSAIIGGFLMGFGARLAHGCNVSAVMTGIPTYSLHGWVFLIFMTLGVLAGIRILTKYLVVF
ncbi:hypothetical protein BHU72_04755 [Desulfuribacillus stibiiarsenatis]|uniref:Uncharacterized protein n=1 Tax=Desulfuribacillus stibiiarsenatis TaxID=1390249 RepID=A0A1E5L5X0_9FIRM|nr:YeeE/YedE family protein [Desulfuribacillus stibiiarsenatis]OEH85403.1 hypothetical protein BHU72_04755 [Desulfuribacillus stibiiarsenatis]